jgi:hypothetical protein
MWLKLIQKALRIGTGFGGMVEDGVETVTLNFVGVIV